MAIKENENKKNLKENDDSMSVLNEDFVESADRVGNLLCNERLKKGLDLDEISQVLCIRRIYLEAIENGNYVELPPLPYSAGFVNSYAKYLGLNNIRITQLFREELDEKPKDKNVFMVEDAGPEASLPAKGYIIGGIAAIVVIALVWSLVAGLSTPKSSENTTSEDVAEDVVGEVEYFSPSTEELTAKTESNPEIVSEDIKSAQNNEPVEQVIMKEESFVEPAAPTKPAKPSTKIEIKITKEDTWIEVRDANKVYFNKVMKPGETYVVPEGNGMLLSAGKYDGVEVYADGVLIPVLQPNKKMRVSLDPFMESAEH